MIEMMIETTETDTKITVEYTTEEIPDEEKKLEEKNPEAEQQQQNENLEQDQQPTTAAAAAADDDVDVDHPYPAPTTANMLEVETEVTDSSDNSLTTTTTTTMENIENTDESTTYSEEIHQSPEYLQKKLYFLLEQLKIMHSELPESYQMRIPYELLSGLANSLVNNTIFEIVKRLMEIQHVTENHLQQLRHQVETEHQIEIQEWMTKISDTEELEHIVKMMKIKHANKLKDTDMKLVLHLDQKVHDQQSTLERAGVPGFYGTDSPKAIKIQMHLLDFILRLSRMKFEPK